VEFLDWLIALLGKHYSGFFSGLGVFLLGLLFINRTRSQNQKIGKNGVGIQAGKNVSISSDDGNK